MYTTNEKAMSITFFLIFSKWNEQKRIPSDLFREILTLKIQTLCLHFVFYARFPLNMMSQGTNGHKIHVCMYFYVYGARKT